LLKGVFVKDIATLNEKGMEDTEMQQVIFTD
jgi:hypothetical protein